MGFQVLPGKYHGVLEGPLLFFKGLHFIVYFFKGTPNKKWWYLQGLSGKNTYGLLGKARSSWQKSRIRK